MISSDLPSNLHRKCAWVEKCASPLETNRNLLPGTSFFVLRNFDKCVSRAYPQPALAKWTVPLVGRSPKSDESRICAGGAVLAKQCSRDARQLDIFLKHAVNCDMLGYYSPFCGLNLPCRNSPVISPRAGFATPLRECTQIVSAVLGSAASDRIGGCPIDARIDIVSPSSCLIGRRLDWAVHQYLFRSNC